MHAGLGPSPKFAQVNPLDKTRRFEPAILGRTLSDFSGLNVSSITEAVGPFAHGTGTKTTHVGAATFSVIPDGIKVPLA